MKQNIFHLILLVIISSNISYSQGVYYSISHPDTAFSGLDLIYDDGFHVLGNAWNFSPPYSGIPIHGEYSFGNVYFFMGEDGAIGHQVYLDNNEISPSLEGFGRVPATFFFTMDGSGNIILPYTKLYGIVACEDTLQGRLTDRLGITEIKKENTTYSINDTLYNLSGICERQTPLKGFAKNDSFLLVLKDNFNDKSLKFNWYDSQKNLVSETIKSFVSFEARTTGISVDGSGNPVFLGWDPADGYNMSLLKTTLQGDSLTKTNIYSPTHPFTPVAISGGQNDNLLIAAYRYNLDYSGLEYFLLCFDGGLNEKWRKPFPNNIRAVTALNGGQGYLVVSVPLSGQPLQFNVGYVNGEGELVSSEEYGEVNDIPEKVKVLNDTLFAVIGTKFIGYQNSTAGNPYASIFVLVDTVQNFLVSGTNGELAGDVFQIKAYPNPSRGTVNVSFSDDYESKPYLVEIHNLAVTKLGSYFLDSTAAQITLDLNDLPPGTYIGTVHFENGYTKSFRFSIY